MSSKRVPNAISDTDWAALARRADKVAPPMFSTEATRRRLANEAQKRKADQS
jgi:hypothetical protein